MRTTVFKTLFLVVVAISWSHNPGKRFFEDSYVKIYPSRGEMLYDEQNSVCLKQFWVPLEDLRYVKKFLPTHCDERLLTVGHPELRLGTAIINLPPPPFLHSSIRRDLRSGSLEFSKEMLKYLVLLGKKIHSGLKKEWKERWDHKLQGK
ncbi:hypothetical protein HOF92_12975 [bacterium]|mgnify:CR=1 FL=1|jgi:hypothetical protein|nr:hypothetical protein [bacterium]